MVRYSTGHALFGTLASWITEEPLVANDETPANSSGASSHKIVEARFTCPRVVSTPEIEVVDLDEVSSAHTKRGCAFQEKRRQEMGQQALGVWLLGPGAPATYTRAALHAWRQEVLKQQNGRALLRSEQRVKFSLTEHLQVPPSPAPVVRALGAMLISTERSLVWGCFCAWRDASQRVSYRRATMMWLMERLALSQTGIMLKASFRCWYHVTLNEKQPTWAQDLRRDVRKLLHDDRAHSEVHEPNTSLFGAKGKVGAPCGNFQSSMILACIILASLLGHVFLLLRHKELAPQATISKDPYIGLDSDGDGIIDGLDRCPTTPPWHKFRSTWQTDWDGDGCLDSIEDSDDDNDAVLNFQDLCPHTLLSDGEVDKDGCTSRQRIWLTQENPILQQYKDKLADIVLEVFIGMFLTAGVNFAWKSRAAAFKVRPLLHHMWDSARACTVLLTIESGKH